MKKLTHFALCPQSRTIRLLMAEFGLAPELVEERAWEFRPAFMAVNPAGELPVLETADGVVICGAYAISEFVAETVAPTQLGSRTGFRPLPGDPEDRAEVRRLIDWFHGKLNREVSRELLAEKVYPRLTAGAAGTPNPDLLRAARSNMRYHLRYIGFLAEQRRWLAGEEASLADLAAAAHLSLADYLGEVPWDQHASAKGWYQRIKSRPSFRGLLADRIPGFPPPAHYANLDF